MISKTGIQNMELLQYRFIMHELNKFESELEWGKDFKIPDGLSHQLLGTLHDKVSHLINKFLSEISADFIDKRST